MIYISLCIKFNVILGHQTPAKFSQPPRGVDLTLRNVTLKTNAREITCVHVNDVEEKLIQRERDSRKIWREEKSVNENIILKCILEKKCEEGCGLDSADSGKDPVTRYFENCKELPDNIKGSWTAKQRLTFLKYHVSLSSVIYVSRNHEAKQNTQKHGENIYSVWEGQYQIRMFS